LAETEPSELLAEKSFVKHELLKPQAVEDRLYQTSILETAKRRSTLIVLPTAPASSFWWLSGADFCGGQSDYEV